MAFKNFGQTIAAKRKEKGLSQPQLAELLNNRGFEVKANSLSKWEKNVNSPNVLQFFALCEILEIEDINEAFNIAIEQNLYAQLNKEGQKKALEYMNLLIKSGMYVREDPVYMVPRRVLKLYDLPVSAGTGQLLDSDSSTSIEVGNEVSANADFGVRVSGNSMEPLYQDKQIIWVHEQPTLSDGEIGVFFLDGEAFVKKYHKTEEGVELISLNQKYAPIKVAPEAVFKTFGKVV